MTGSILPRINVDYLNKILFDQEEFLNILPYKEYSKIPTEHLQVWSVLNGIYTFPTIELIDFLKEKIADRSAIEICAGNGSIGRALDITSTDSYVQHAPEIKAYYKALGQSPTMPGCDVEKFEALEAIQKFNPKVIIGCDALAASTFGEDVKPENKFDITTDFCAGVDLGWNKEPHQVCTRGANEEFSQGVSVGKLLRQQLSPVLWINLSN